MDINGAIQTLAREIGGSAEFSALKRSKARLSQNPAYEKRLVDFLTKQNRLNSGQISPGEAELLYGELQGEYTALTAIPDINNYFTASEAFNQTLNTVMQGLHSVIDKMLNN